MSDEVAYLTSILRAHKGRHVLIYTSLGRGHTTLMIKPEGAHPVTIPTALVVTAELRLSGALIAQVVHGWAVGTLEGVRREGTANLAVILNAGESGLSQTEKQLLADVLTGYIENTEDGYACGDVTKAEAEYACKVVESIAAKLKLPMQDLKKAIEHLRKEIRK